MNEFYITATSLANQLHLLMELGSACVWSVQSSDGSYVTTYQLITEADEDTVREFMYDNEIDYICVEL